jgi:outer membrane protein assembly factor BamB
MKRRHFAFLRWSVVLGVCALVLAGCDWPMLGYNPAHTGYNNTETTIGAGNAATLTKKFVAPDAGVYDGSSPAVVGGVLYVDVGDGLYAFDARGTTGCSAPPKTCAPLWKGQYGAGLDVPNSPAVANGVVFVSAQDGGDLQAYDAKGVTGCSGDPKVCSPLWTAPMHGGSAPTVVNGIVYVNTNDHGLSAFDANGVNGCSGVPKVCTPLWTGSEGGRDSSPAVVKGLVFTGGGDNLAAFDANGTTGCSGTPKVCTPLWQATVDPTGSPAVANGIVYTDTIFGLQAFNATNGAPLWHADVHCVYCDSSPAVANGIVYVGGGLTKRMYAYDASTGDPKWTATTGDILRSSPTVANGVVYLGTNDWNVYAYDATTGAQLWKFKTDANIWSSTAIANGMVYVGSMNTLYAFGLP